MGSAGENSSGCLLNEKSDSGPEVNRKCHSSPTDNNVDSAATGNVVDEQARPTLLAEPGLDIQGGGLAGGNVKSVVSNRGLRVLFVNLFKNNRLVKDDYKLDYVENGTAKLNFGYEHIDSIKRTYGICLLGFVVNGHPPTAALRDLVKRWGSNVQFQTHEHGWITFTFPSLELKNKVLNGGNYKVFGHHLFLKEMPRCFRFREEDLTSFPAWVQVHGLPPDCWSSHILSNIISRIGRPLHVDMLTFDRNKKTKYARVLVEIDTSIQHIDGMRIGLPIGDVDIKFVYEVDVKTCNVCKGIGHTTESCNRQVIPGSAAGGIVGTECAVQGHRSRSNFRRHNRAYRSRTRSTVNLKKNDAQQGPHRLRENNKAVPVEPQNHGSTSLGFSLPEVGTVSSIERRNGCEDSIELEAVNDQRPSLVKVLDKGKKVMEEELEVHNLDIGDCETLGDMFKSTLSKKQQKKTEQNQEET